MTRETTEGYAAILEHLHKRFFNHKGPKIPHAIICNDGTIGSAYGLKGLFGIEDNELKGQEYKILLSDDLYLNALIPLAYRLQAKPILGAAQQAAFVAADYLDAVVLSPRHTLSVLNERITTFAGDSKQSAWQTRIRARALPTALTLDQDVFLYNHPTADGPRYAGALMTFGKAHEQQDARGWVSKSWKDYITFSSGPAPHALTDEYVLVLPESMNDHVPGKENVSGKRFGTELKLITEQQAQHPLVLDFQSVVKMQEAPLNGLMWLVRDWVTAKKLIVGNPSSDIRELVKKAVKAYGGEVKFAELVYPLPRVPSLQKDKDFEELNTSEGIESFLKERLIPNAYNVSAPGVCPVQENPEGKSIDVRLPGPTAQ